MKLDILGIVAHPDDAELCFGGTLLVHKKMGYKIGIVDLTKGELGTRGSAEIRAQETQNASEILGLDVRENLNLGDGIFRNNYENQLEVIRVIRKYKPTIVITNALYDRHPDHERAAQLVETAYFLSGIRKISCEGMDAFRPQKLLFSIQAIHANPDFVVDTSEVEEERIKAILAYKSQFYDPKNTEPETYLTSPDFLNSLRARLMMFGQQIGAKYAEGFNIKQFIGLTDLFHLR